jgi:D-3-phosphoglycerate dehydrogenase / 2-oxoglutarate reductase
MNKGSGKVLIAAPVHPVLTDGLAALGYICIIKEDITQQIAADLIHDCTGVITSTRLQLDKALLDAAPQLRWIGRMGSGMEVIDVPYATGKGIKCYSSPEGNSNAVGEHALGMLLSLIRRITWSQQEVQKGLWLREENRGTELEGKTLGIIGFGYTGAAFAKKLSGFDIKILAYDKYKKDAMPSDIVNCQDLAPIYEQADFVSFHVPLQEDTKYYFNESFIKNMKKPFVLINTSRGIVVDTKALWAGLQSGKVTGACLDVWEQEPLSKMNTEIRDLLNKIVALPNAIITPHIAGYTVEALYKMSNVLLCKINNV